LLLRILATKYKEAPLRPIRYATTVAVSLCITAIVVQPAVADRGVMLSGKVISNSSLAEQRGGHETQVFNDMQVNGKVVDNTAINNVTGHNTITNAFTGASGVPLVVQNSGNNVLIQNATIINLEVH
jgi:hypothetical protein